jgi:hypothetical protein
MYKDYFFRYVIIIINQQYFAITHTHTHTYTWMYVLLSNFTIKPQYKKHINQTHETVFCSTSISITVLTKHLNF